MSSDLKFLSSLLDDSERDLGKAEYWYDKRTAELITVRQSRARLVAAVKAERARRLAAEIRLMEIELAPILRVIASEANKTIDSKPS